VYTGLVLLLYGVYHQFLSYDEHSGYCVAGSNKVRTKIPTLQLCILKFAYLQSVA